MRGTRTNNGILGKETKVSGTVFLKKLPKQRFLTPLFPDTFVP